MSTVQSLYDFLQYRRDIQVGSDDLIHIVNAAIRTISKRLYFLGSDLITDKMEVSLYAEVSYTADTIAFVDSSPDTITDSALQFVAEGFVSGMHITTDEASNPGPFEISTAVAGTLTLVTADSVTDSAEGSDVTITSVDDYGDLPSDFWGLKDKPYIDGKTWSLNPSPGVAAELTYTSAGEPRYYKIRGQKIYVIPAASTDSTIKADYYKKPTALTADTDTLPFNEMFDDLISEYVIQYFRGEQTAADLTLLLHNGVDLLASQYDRRAPADFPVGIVYF